MLATSLIEGALPEVESTEMRVSTVADTWIHLTYVIQGGERNRALTIVKSRGTAHSNQVRELILSGEGITLANVYSVGGEVVMGTLRWEMEQAERAAKVKAHAELERKRSELERVRAEAKAQIEELQRRLAEREAEIEVEINEQARVATRKAAGTQERRRLRRADVIDHE